MEKYLVERLIGEGSFGRALLVQCRSSQVKYVLKEIQLPKNGSKSDKSRREAVLLSQMKHNNIVAFREAFEDDILLCIVMEYCSGGDLLQKIQQQRNTQFTVENILKWFAQMCAAAKHVHDKRVLHRDLKSKNIFLTENGTVKLGDFGSACVLNSSKAFAQTYVGTPYYVAPEIWDNKPYNNKSDVWSLACVLYELCTLKHPFQASSWKSLIVKVCRGAYPPLPRHLPYEVHYLIKQMFKTNPKDRPSLHTILTSHRVSRLLRSHLDQQDVQATERRRVQRWDLPEGKKVTEYLGEKSLMHTALSEGIGSSHVHSESGEPLHRKQWAPSDSVLQQLHEASLMSSVSLTTEEHRRAEEQRKTEEQRRTEEQTNTEGQRRTEQQRKTTEDQRKTEQRKTPEDQWRTEDKKTEEQRKTTEETRKTTEEQRKTEEQSRTEEQRQTTEDQWRTEQRRTEGQRKQWTIDPCERLLRVLEKATLHRASSTFIIHRGGADPLVGPLSSPHSDDTDGLMEEEMDEERLQPRSDDEDTDFEEDSPCDWVQELEKMFSH